MVAPSYVINLSAILALTSGNMEQNYRKENLLNAITSYILLIATSTLL